MGAEDDLDEVCVGAEMTLGTMQDTVQWMSDQVETISSMDRTL